MHHGSTVMHSRNYYYDCDAPRQYRDALQELAVPRAGVPGHNRPHGVPVAPGDGLAVHLEVEVEVEVEVVQKAAAG
jgi:hypothetical protein